MEPSQSTPMNNTPGMPSGTAGSIFTGLLEKEKDGSQIFKNKDVMRSNYTPDKLPHRTEQINHLAAILVDALKGNVPSNVFIYGKTGTGKTAVVNHLGNELKKTGTDLDKNVHYIYINCGNVDTSYRVLTHIANSFVNEGEERLPTTGLPTDEVYNILRDNMEKKGGVTSIVLDEIDRLFYKSGDSVLYSILTMTASLKSSKAHIIGISNDLNFREQLDTRVKSRLGEDEIIFEPYNATQLEDILRERASAALKDGALDSTVVSLCAALAAQENGDARMALDILREAAELGDREGAKQITEKHVRRAQNKIETDRVSHVIRTLPIQSKLVLLAVVMKDESVPKDEELITGDVYTKYENLCKEAGADPLTQRRVADLISELDMLGIIHAKLVSFGRGGRTKIIKLNVPSHSVKDIFEADEELKPLLEYKATKQTKLL